MREDNVSGEKWYQYAEVYMFKISVGSYIIKDLLGSVGEQSLTLYFRFDKESANKLFRELTSPRRWE